MPVVSLRQTLTLFFYLQRKRGHVSPHAVTMDFLKSAVASAISKGPAFGYTFGDRVDLNDSIWTLHNGTKRVWPRYLHTNTHANSC